MKSTNIFYSKLRSTAGLLGLVGLMIAGSVLLVEGVVLHRGPADWVGTGLHALLVVLLVLPVLYGFVVRPLQRRVENTTHELQRMLALDAKLSAVWQDSGFALYLCDPHDPAGVTIIDCNPFACQLYGYARHELIGHPLQLIETGSESESRTHWLKRLRQTRRSERRTQHRRKDGSLIEVDATLSLVEVEGKELVLGLNQDITAQCQLESSLAFEQQLWQALLDSIGDSIYFKDTNSQFLRASRSLARKLGLEHAEDLIGKTDRDFFSAEHVEAALADERHTIQTGDPVLNKIEKETRPDGTFTWGLTSKVPLRRKDGTVIGTCGITKDVTELVETQERLRKLSQAVEQSPATIVITDRTGRIEYTNPNFTLVTGYTAEEARGQNPRILKSGEIPADGYRELWRTISRGDTWRGLFHNKKKNGELYWDEASISPIRDADGKITHYLAVKMDVTERKLAAEELTRAKEAAEAAARAKSEFLANMSHEIRTPMNGVIGMVGLLLDTKLDQEQRQFAETVRDSADCLLVVINDILDFSKIEAGKLSFEEIDFNVVEVIESALELNAGRAQGKGLELLNEIAPDVPVNLRGDPGRLRQILVNLLSNAVKFTDQGEVVLRARLDQAEAAHVTVEFRVTDSGIGISPEAQARLFQSFEQADNSTTRKYGGTGLGLAISKQLVKQMEGTIGIESVEGQGSTFWFTAKFARATHPVRPKRTGHEHLYNLRVLVVDDNATNRQILRHQIFAWKMQKGSAAGGHQALKLLREVAAAGQPYEVALLDMQMPEMDGMALARAIKADARIASTRLIMLTSLGDRFSAEELRTVGLEAYLVKPVKKDRLFETLLRVVDGTPLPVQTTGPEKSDAKPINQVGAGLSILLAEDNRVNQKVATTQIRKFGCEVEVVADGRAVLSALERKSYDMIFMDIQMPEMDGYQATEAIRQAEQKTPESCGWTAPIHIIAMTANALEGDREKCIAAGMDDYISKPVRPEDIEQSLQRYGDRAAAVTS